MNVCCPTLGKLTRIFAPWSNPHPLPALPPPPPRGYIDRCIKFSLWIKSVYASKRSWRLTKWPISGRPTADKEPADSWRDSRSQVLNFGLVPSLSRFRKLLTTINALKQTELRKNFTVVRKSIYPSLWQNSSFSLNV